MTSICQYLSIDFLVSKVLTLMVVKRSKITSPKVVCSLFPALIGLFNEFFPYRLVRNLPLEQAVVL